MAAGRWIKRIVIALVAIILVLFAAVAIALTLIDTRALKNAISDQVEAATGRQLAIEGPLSLSFFPWLGFELGETRLANAQGFGDAPFAALDRAELRVRIVPLFSREVVIDTVVLHGFEANLARNADGVTNWADLAGEPGAEAEPAPEPEEGPAGEGEPAGDGLAGLSLRVEGVELENAAFHWRDATTGQDVRVRDLNLTTGPLAPNEATPVRLSVAVEQAGGVAVELSADTSLTFDPAAQTAALDDLAVDVVATGDTLPGGRVAAGLQSRVRVDAKAGRAVIDPLRLSLLDRINGVGRVSARFGSDVPSFDGNLAIAAFDPRAVMEALDIALPETSDDQVLREASLRLDFAGTPARVALDGLEARLDDTTLTGSLDAELGDVPTATFDLNADAIDVDRYLPPGSPAPAEAVAAEPEAGEGADPIASLPLEALRGVNVDGNVGIDRVGYSGIDLEEVRLAVQLAGGLLTLERADLRVAGGTLETSGRLDARTDTPSVRLRTGIGGVRAEPFLNAFLGQAPATGRLDTTLALDTAGATLDEWIGKLSGELAMTFAEGAVQGFNIAQKIRVAGAKLTGDEVDEAKAVQRTDFSVLRFVARIRDGVLRSDELDLRAPLLRVSGDGSLDLRKRDVDYTARVLVTGTLAGEGGKAASELRGLEIPIRLKGPVTGPEIDVQLAKAFQRRETAEAREKAEAAEREAERRKEAAEREARERREAAEAEAKAEAEQKKQELEQKKDRAEQEAKEKLEKELEGLFD